MPPPIRHGSLVTAALVGPAAGGFGTLRPVPALRIGRGALPTGARSIAGDASYGGERIAGPHLLIEGVAVDGSIDIGTPLPVVLRGVAVRPRGGVPVGIHVRPGSGPVLIAWCDVGARIAAAGIADAARMGLGLLLRAPGARVQRCRISRVADGIHPDARRIAITETLVEDLVAGPGDHNDGIQVGRQGGDLTVARCRILNPNRQTSCLFLSADTIAIQSCYLAGGGWTVYGGSRPDAAPATLPRNIAITDTVFGRDYHPRCGVHGPLTHWSAAPGSGNVFTANRYPDGSPVPVA